MAWRLAHALSTLRKQIDSAHPKRSKRSDGTVGDLAHSKRKSDHNPNRAGVVQAIDLTHDPQGGFDSYRFAELLRTQRDSRIKYVISNGKIFNSTQHPWQWRKYNGSNPHSAHVHVSVRDNPGAYDDTRNWTISKPMAMGIADIEAPPPEPTEAQDYYGRCWWEEVSDKGTEEESSESQPSPASRRPSKPE